MTQKIPSFSEDKMHTKKTENYELRERRKLLIGGASYIQDHRP